MSFSNIHLDLQKKKKLDIEELRKELNILAATSNPKVKSSDKLQEISLVRDSIVKSASPPLISDSLSSALKEKKEKPEIASVLRMEAQEATENPTSNVIDNHVQGIINTEPRNHFSPDINEIKKISRHKIQNSHLHNLYRENLRIKSIHEEVVCANFHYLLLTSRFTDKIPDWN